MIDNRKLLRRIDDLIAARNAAYEAQQRFSDAHVGRRPEPSAEVLYEATYDLCHRIDNVINSVEWENLILGLTPAPSEEITDAIESMLRDEGFVNEAWAEEAEDGTIQVWVQSSNPGVSTAELLADVSREIRSRGFTVKAIAHDRIIVQP